MKGLKTGKEIFTFDQVADLLRTEDENVIGRLFREADITRRECVGEEVHLRGIIEFSNRCEKNCLYCGLRGENKALPRYRMSMEEIFNAAQKAKGLGCRTVVLQSGEDRSCDIEDLCSLVRKIRKRLELAVTVSVGERSFGEYEKLKEAGTHRYLLKFETSDAGLYKKIKPDGDIAGRFESLKWLKELGFQTGAGIMTGLPGQSPESIARDILLFDELGLDMVGNGPFIPHPETPFKDQGAGELITSLKVVALTRLVTRNAHIPATTALRAIHPEGWEKALTSGANVIMPNVTPRKYKELYDLYPGKPQEHPEESGGYVRCILASQGRPVSTGYGHGFKKNRDT